MNEQNVLIIMCNPAVLKNNRQFYVTADRDR